MPETLHNLHEGAIAAEIVLEDTTTEIMNVDVGGEENTVDIQTNESDDEKVHHRSMFGKMKELKGKFRKFVRVLRASLPSAAFQNDEGVNVRVEVVSSPATMVGPYLHLLGIILMY